MDRDEDAAKDFYYSNSVKQVLGVSGSDSVFRTYERKWNNERVQESFAEFLGSAQQVGILLKILKSSPRRAEVTRARVWEMFLALWEANRVEECDLAHFANRLCPAFYRMQRSTVRFLTSFDFTLALEDVNVHVRDLETGGPDSCLEPELAGLTREDVASFLADHVLGGPRWPGSADERSRDTRGRLKTIMIKVLVLSYKRLCKGISLDRLCDALNGARQLNFSNQFWSESLLVRVMLHYADFDLRSKVTRLLHERAVLPLVLADIDQGLGCDKPGCPSPGVDAGTNQAQDSPAMREDGEHSDQGPDPLDSDSEHFMSPLANLFAQFHLKKQLGVVSYALGSANYCRMGKSQLLNQILYTKFETGKSDSFSATRVEADLGQNFYPKRDLAVVDCNYQNGAFFRAVCELANVVLLTVSYSDLVGDFDGAEAEVAELTRFCTQNGIFVVILVRDWGWHCWSEARLGDEPGGRAFLAEKYRDSADEDEAEETEADRILDELRDYRRFVENAKKGQKRDERGDKIYAKKKQAEKQFAQSKAFAEDGFVSCVKLKNMTSSSSNANSVRSLEKLKKTVNNAIKKARKHAPKFTKKQFKLFASQIKSDSSDKYKIQQVKTALRKLKSVFRDPDFTRDQLFPFNQLWTRKNGLYRRLGATDSSQFDRRRKLEREIARTERRIASTRISPALRSIFGTICGSPHSYTLVALFEQALRTKRGIRRLLRSSKRGAPGEDQAGSRPAVPDPESGVFDMTLFWRNVKPFLTGAHAGLAAEEKRAIVRTIEQLFAKGYGFELVDGDHFTYQGFVLDLLRDAVHRDDEVVTLAVQGPQSSGKSTLVNLQFGTQFKTGVGKCTAGICGYLMRFEHSFEDFAAQLGPRVASENVLTGADEGHRDKGCSEGKAEIRDLPHFDRDLGNRKCSSKSDEFEIADDNGDLRWAHRVESAEQTGLGSETGAVRCDRRKKRFIMFLDSQGLLSQEVRDDDLDQKVCAFIFAVSQVVQANFSGCLSNKFADLLQTAYYSYWRLRQKRGNTPSRVAKPGQLRRDVCESTANPAEPERLGEGRCNPDSPKMRDARGGPARQMRDREPPQTLAAKSAQQIFFVSNCNFNAGDREVLSQMRRDISRRIHEVKHALDQTTGGRSSSPFSDDPSRIVVLGNAIETFYDEKNSDAGLDESVTRITKSQNFVRDLHALKTRTVDALARAAQCERGPRSFAEVDRVMRALWSQIYYFLENHGIGHLRRRMLEQRYQAQVQSCLRSHVLLWRLESGFIDESWSEGIKVAPQSQSQSRGQSHPKQAEGHIAERSRSEVYARIFGGCGTQIARFIAQKNKSEGHFKRLIACIREDVSTVQNAHAETLGQIEQELDDWIEAKKNDLVDVIRRQINWQRSDLLRVYKSEFQVLEFYEGVFKLNLLRMACAHSQRKSRQTRRKRKPPRQSPRNGSGVNSTAHRKHSKGVHWGQPSKSRALACQLDDADPNRDLRQFVAECVTDMFRGLFGRHAVADGREAWTSGEFQSRAEETLAETRFQLFTAELGQVVGVREDLAQRLSACSLLGISRDDFKVVSFDFVRDKERVLDNIQNELRVLPSQKGATAPANELTEVLRALADLGVIRADDESIAEVVGSPQFAESGVRHLGAFFEWDLDALGPGSRYRVYSDERVRPILTRSDSGGGQVLQLWNDERVDSFEKTKAELFKALGEQSLEYDLFLHPGSCDSPVDLQKVFEVVANSFDVSGRLASRLDEHARHVFEERVSGGLETVEEVRPRELRHALEQELVGELIRGLDAELGQHGVRASVYLRDRLRFLVHKRVCALLADAILKTLGKSSASESKEKGQVDRDPKKKHQGVESKASGKVGNEVEYKNKAKKRQAKQKSKAAINKPPKTRRESNANHQASAKKDALGDTTECRDMRSGPGPETGRTVTHDERVEQPHREQTTDGLGESASNGPNQQPNTDAAERPEPEIAAEQSADYALFFEGVREQFREYQKAKFWPIVKSDLKKAEYPSKAQIVTQLDDRFKLGLADAVGNEVDGEVREYLQRPFASIRREFEQLFENRVSECQNSKRLAKHRANMIEELESCRKYVNSLKELLAGSNLIQLVDDLEKRSRRSDRPWQGSIHFDLFLHLIHCSDDSRSLPEQLAVLTEQAQYSGVLEELDDWGRASEFMRVCRWPRAVVPDLGAFLTRCGRWFDLCILETIKDEAMFSVRHAFSNRIGLKKHTTVAKLVGCLATCPDCNRPCEREMDHAGKHHAETIGHGIVGLHEINIGKTSCHPDALPKTCQTLNATQPTRSEIERTRDALGARTGRVDWNFGAGRNKSGKKAQLCDLHNAVWTRLTGTARQPGPSGQLSLTILGSRGCLSAEGSGGSRLQIRRDLIELLESVSGAAESRGEAVRIAFCVFDVRAEETIISNSRISEQNPLREMVFEASNRESVVNSNNKLPIKDILLRVQAGCSDSPDAKSVALLFFGDQKLVDEKRTYADQLSLDSLSRADCVRVVSLLRENYNMGVIKQLEKVLKGNIHWEYHPQGQLTDLKTSILRLVSE